MDTSKMPASYKELAKWAMALSLKQGCQGAQISVHTGSDSEFTVRDRQLDKVQQSASKKMVLKLYADGRYGSFSTNRMDKRDLRTFIERAVESVRCLAPDPCRQLPAPEKYDTGRDADLALYDPNIAKLQPGEKRQLAQDAAGEILGADARILSVQASYCDSEMASFLVASNGFEGERSASDFTLYVSVSVKGEGESRPEADWYERSLFFDGLIKKNVGKTALGRALRKLGQKKIGSGKYPMLVDNIGSVRLLAPLLSALSGSALQQKNSFLLDKKGRQVLSEKLTLIDDPRTPRCFGSRYFDDEGVATQRRAVFNKGVLETYFIDTYNALKMGVEPTVSSPSRLVVEGGRRSLEEMAAALDKGVLVTGFNGGNCNGTSGDFSFGIEGFLIENGKMAKPVSEMNITGNMLALWKNLAEVGNDPRQCTAYQIPSLLFQDVDFSGL